jgi:hypothetical protein
MDPLIFYGQSDTNNVGCDQFLDEFSLFCDAVDVKCPNLSELMRDNMFNGGVSFWRRVLMGIRKLRSGRMMADERAESDTKYSR